MNFIKTEPNITREDFIERASKIKKWKSITGREYEINQAYQDNEETRIYMLHIYRLSSGKPWPVDLNGVYDAYINLQDFKTKNFAPYVLSRTHSPSLGLLVEMGLLTKK